MVNSVDQAVFLRYNNTPGRTHSILNSKLFDNERYHDN